MSYLNKSYKFVKQENFDTFLKFFDIPAETIEKLLKAKPEQKLVKDGDFYILISSSPDGAKETKFKSGVEFDDTLGPAKAPAKTTIVVDGNTVTQTTKGPKGVITMKREFNGDDLVTSVTTASWDGVAKTYFKA